MHIGINAQLLSLGQNYRNGGVSRYIRYLLTELAKAPGEHIYTVYVNGPDVIEHLGVQHPQITYISAPWSESRPIERVLWEDRERVSSEEEYKKAYQTNSGALYFAQCEDPNET